MINTKIAGNLGEDLACEYLKRNDYKILGRNFRIRGGEVDIVAEDGVTLVFVEVKTRYSHEFGDPLEAITPWKIKALLKTALFYIEDKNLGDISYRIDVVSVDYSQDREKPEIELIKNITS